MNPRCIRFALIFSTLFWCGMAVGVVSLVQSCQTAPSQRVVEVQTLKAVGQSAETTVALSAKLYNSRTITAAQARAVLDFYNNKFQPAFRVAVAAVQSDLTPASPDLISLASQLSSMLVSFQQTK